MRAPYLKVNEHVANVRGSGHSTALALHILATAIANPGEDVEVHDHFETKRADYMLYGTVLEFARALGLHLGFNSSLLTVKVLPRGVRGEAPYVTR